MIHIIGLVLAVMASMIGMGLVDIGVSWDEAASSAVGFLLGYSAVSVYNELTKRQF